MCLSDFKENDKLITFFFSDMDSTQNYLLVFLCKKKTLKWNHLLALSIAKALSCSAADINEWPQTHDDGLIKVLPF